MGAMSDAFKPAAAWKRAAQKVKAANAFKTGAKATAKPKSIDVRSVVNRPRITS